MSGDRTATGTPEAGEEEAGPLSAKELRLVDAYWRAANYLSVGHPPLIHRLTYRRTNHDNLHVRGYREEGTTTTPFDMVMLNDLDRFRFVMDVVDRVPGLGSRAARIRQQMADRRVAARAYTREHGEDRPEIQHWTWPH